MLKIDSTKRFSKTVENYLAYRPGYPSRIINFMQENFGLNSDSLVADIGSGTGK